MVASYKKSGAAGGGYYVDRVEMGAARTADDYYSSGQIDVPGVWYVGKSADGERTSAIGIIHGVAFGSIKGRDDAAIFKRLANGYNPTKFGDAKLVQNAGSKDRVALHDFTLSAPKSVSVIWSQSDAKTQLAIEAAQAKGVQAHLDFMSTKSYSRKGKDGIIKSESSLRAAIFNHGSSRENDPQLHTHAVILNICERADGTTGALETLEMMRWAGSAASLYHADLALGMREIGFKTECANKIFEVSGVPINVINEFSQRRAQILAAVQAQMNAAGVVGDAKDASRKVLKAATLATRSDKGEMSQSDLEFLWTERGAALGFSQKEALALMNNVPPEKLTPEELLVEARAAVRELTQTYCIFEEPKLITAVAVHLVGRTSSENILKAVEEIIKVDLLKAICNQEVRDGEKQEREIFTTVEMVALERRMMQLADRPDSAHILENVNFPSTLRPEQLAAARHATSDINSVSIIEGTAGAGKTFTMQSIAEIYKAQGYTVTGLANSWSAGLNLKKEAKLEYGRAISGWVNSVNRGDITLTAKHLIVLDEAGMIDVRQMKDVLAIAERAGAKVILLGDTLQQKAIAAGDALRVIAAQNSSVRLSNIVRQTKDVDRQAVHAFFNGDAQTGLAPYIKRGAVKILADEVKTHDALIADWQKSRLANPAATHLILAVDNASVMEINRLGHVARQKAGELGKGGEFSVLGCTKGQTVEISVVDKVELRVNDKSQNFYNRQQGVITDINGSKISLEIEGRKLVIDALDKKWQHRNGGLGLTHAYASTVSAAQGASIDHVFVKDSLALNRASAGVAMSRHKEDCQVYVDQKVRYDAKMQTVIESKWYPQSDFKNDELLARIGKSWSKKPEKHSTLDFPGWTRGHARVDPVIEAKILHTQDASMVVSWAKERLREAMKITGVPVNAVLPYQAAKGFELPAPRSDDKSALKRGVEALQARDISLRVQLDAQKQGFLTFDDKGPVYCGRRPADGALVSTVSDSRPEAMAMRERFPPILRGSSERVDIVKTPVEALAIWTQQDRDEQQRSTVVVTGGKDDALSLPHTQKMLEQAEAVTRYDVAAELDRLRAQEPILRGEEAQREQAGADAQAAQNEWILQESPEATESPVADEAANDAKFRNNFGADLEAGNSHIAQEVEAARVSQDQLQGYVL